MHMGEACYGVKCKVSRTLGMFDPSEETKKQVQELYNALIQEGGGENVRFGYFQVISDHYETSQHEVYTL